MASVYKLSYTAKEIDEKLGKINNLAEKSELPTKISDLTNDSGYATESDIQKYAQPKGDYALKSEIPAVPDVPVQSINGQIGNVNLSASDVGALPEDTVIPSIAYDLNTSGQAADSKLTGDAINELINLTSTNYDESIIGLSVDGTTVTYIKGDGSVHSFETQDTNTTYSLGTDEATGLTKLYATTGTAEDGTMTQKAIKTELDKKVGVTIDDTQDMLIFTI